MALPIEVMVVKELACLLWPQRAWRYRIESHVRLSQALDTIIWKEFKEKKWPEYHSFMLKGNVTSRAV